MFIFSGSRSRIHARSMPSSRQLSRCSAGTRVASAAQRTTSCAELNDSGSPMHTGRMEYSCPTGWTVADVDMRAQVAPSRGLIPTPDSVGHRWRITPSLSGRGLAISVRRPSPTPSTARSATSAYRSHRSCRCPRIRERVVSSITLIPDDIEGGLPRARTDLSLDIQVLGDRELPEIARCGVSKPYRRGCIGAERAGVCSPEVSDVAVLATLPDRAPASG